MKIPSGFTDADLQRVLDAATLEINVEIGYRIDAEDPDVVTYVGTRGFTIDEALALAFTTNLARAQDLWLVEGLPVGVIGLGGETPLLSPRDSWVRHANTLAPLKKKWGIA